jgi:hypothetical protein
MRNQNHAPQFALWIGSRKETDRKLPGIRAVPDGVRSSNHGRDNMWDRNVITPDMPAMLRKPKRTYLVGRGFPREQALAILAMWDHLTGADLVALGFGPRPTVPRPRAGSVH